MAPPTSPQVHNIDVAKQFYGETLGLEEGRSSTKWQDYAMHGHQVVVHWVGEEYRAQDYVNPVDGDEVPVPHFGLQMPTYELWKDVVDRVKAAGIPFIIEPTLRFEGAPGEQWTCFFKDPSGNNLEFKHMSKPQNLFAKYNVAEGKVFMNEPTVISDTSPSSWGQWPAPAISTNSTDAAGALVRKFPTNRRAFATGTSVVNTVDDQDAVQRC